MGLYNFISLFGIVLLTGLAALFSSDRKNINWHIVVWCVSFQMLFAWFLFVLPAGVKCFHVLNDGVVRVMDASLAGAKFLFGPLAVPPGGGESLGFIFAFQVFPSIIFFSSLVSILYYFNVFPVIIRWFARVFTRLMNISGAESVCAVSNLFVGIESAFTVRPYLEKMTRSELCVVLTAGMASVSSNVLAVYVFSLVDVFPKIAGHLISASLLSVPAAIMMAKVLLPENDVPETLGLDVSPVVEREESLFEAVINGANGGVRLIVGIVALLIAVLGLVELLDIILGALGAQWNQWTGSTSVWSLNGILSRIFYPFTLIMGVPLEDAGLMSSIIGERLIVTELTAYQNLASVLKDDLVMHNRSVVVTTYALCGFAHVASMSIFVGGVSALVPHRKKDIAELGVKSLIAATLACLTTGCVAGVFFVEGYSAVL